MKIFPQQSKKWERFEGEKGVKFAEFGRGLERPEPGHHHDRDAKDQQGEE